MNNTPRLKVRGRLVASHQIPVLSTNPVEFSDTLSATIDNAPALFKHAPVILDLTESPEVSASSIGQLVDICRSKSLVPYALTGLATQKPLAYEQSLAWLENKKSNKPIPHEAHPGIEHTQVITRPVRSGQQVYAKDANLLIMSHVSAGAEIVADGNIHVFGALRGRAIAGAVGNTHGEIVCQHMEAELLAIAGTYRVQENFPAGSGAVRCHLNGESLEIDYLSPSN